VVRPERWLSADLGPAWLKCTIPVVATMGRMCRVDIRMLRVLAALDEEESHGDLQPFRRSAEGRVRGANLSGARFVESNLVSRVGSLFVVVVRDNAACRLPRRWCSVLVMVLGFGR
jgi:hypothetical protein